MGLHYFRILPQKYCSRRFGARSPSWKLPAVGTVAGLVKQGDEEVSSVSVSAVVPMPAAVRAASRRAGGCRVEGAGGSCKRVLHVPGFSQGVALRVEGAQMPCSGRGFKCQEEAAFGTSWGA